MCPIQLPLGGGMVCAGDRTAERRQSALPFITDAHTCLLLQTLSLVATLLTCFGFRFRVSDADIRDWYQFLLGVCVCYVRMAGMATPVRMLFFASSFYTF
jgi:hypothetical protein